MVEANIYQTSWTASEFLFLQDLSQMSHVANLNWLKSKAIWSLPYKNSLSHIYLYPESYHTLLKLCLAFIIIIIICKQSFC